MDQNNLKENEDKDVRIQAAIINIQNCIYKNFKDIVRAYNVSNNTLQNYIIKCNTRANAHKWQQILSNVKEKIFV